MSEELYPYYERELIFIRQLAGEFARKYPAAAGRLVLEEDRSADPHVERLIESFALLAGRVHHKLDEEFPELIQALLGVLYPHYLAPIPSMAVLQFVLDPKRTKLPDGFTIPARSRLRTLPVGPASCKYRTAHAVTLWPVILKAADFLLPPFPPGPTPPQKTEAILRLNFECVGGLPLSAMSLDTLRFHLSGEPTMIATLYELLFNNAISVVILPLDGPPGLAPIVLDPDESLLQVGFEPDEGILPYPRQSFIGYRLLTEFFAYPAKFLFIDIKGLQQASQAGFGNQFEVRIYLDRGSETHEQGIDRDTFRLGCAPVVNLFEQTAEPISLTYSKHEHMIVPDVTNLLGMEIFSVESVVGSDTRTGTTRDFRPFYAFQHGTTREKDQAFYVASRRTSRRTGDRGTDVHLSLVDLGFDPYAPAETTLVIRTTCTNRDLPFDLRRAGDRIAFDLEAAAPLATIRCLRLPTLPLRAPIRRGAFWRLVSHLNLNYLSLADSQEGREALQEILRLYDFTGGDASAPGSVVSTQMIEGLTEVSCRRVTGRIAADAGTEVGYCRGIEVTIELDEQKFIGTGAYLFASVLERFFGLYASLNSFTQLVLRSKEDKRIIKRWPPRAGAQQMI